MGFSSLKPHRYCWIATAVMLYSLMNFSKIVYFLFQLAFLLFEAKAEPTIYQGDQTKRVYFFFTCQIKNSHRLQPLLFLPWFVQHSSDSACVVLRKGFPFCPREILLPYSKSQMKSHEVLLIPAWAQDDYDLYNTPASRMSGATTLIMDYFQMWLSNPTSNKKRLKRPTL